MAGILARPDQPAEGLRQPRADDPVVEPLGAAGLRRRRAVTGWILLSAFLSVIGVAVVILT